MKKSYIKLIIFQFSIFLILGLNSFFSSILKNYYMILFLILVLILFKLLFGFEKDRHRYTKDIIFEIIIFSLIFFLLYYISGIVIGFAKTGSNLNWYGFKTFIIPITIIAISKEFLRYQMLSKAEGNRILTITTAILFMFIDITNAIAISDLATYKEILFFLSLTLLPTISNNIMTSYLALKVGYIPNIVYTLIYELYTYFVPIVPNPTEYIKSIIDFLLPIALTFRLYLYFNKTKDEQEYYRDSKLSYIFLAFPLIVVTTLVYFVSGYFKYYSIAIASGSMRPIIKKGDVVIVDKNYHYDDYEIGQVIAYKKDNSLVVHRLIEIVKDNDKYYFYTKGDANNEPDNYKIEQSSVVGVVKFKIAKIGFPTVWLNETIKK